MHRNPVKRGLVDEPEQWAWSSFLYYWTGLEGTVEIESFWTAARTEALSNSQVSKGRPGAPGVEHRSRPDQPGYYESRSIALPVLTLAARGFHQFLPAGEHNG